VLLPHLVIRERPSPLGLDATVEKITQAALAAGQAEFTAFAAPPR